jgi:hypothetical protein
MSRVLLNTSVLLVYILFLMLFAVRVVNSAFSVAKSRNRSDVISFSD